MDKKISFTSADLEALFPGLRIEAVRREDLDAAQAHLDLSLIHI